MTTKVLERRLDKLERDLGASDGPRFVPVVVQPGEDREQALEQALEEDGLTRDKVGRVLYFDRAEKQVEQVELMSNLDESIAGQREFWSELYDTIRDRKQRISTTILAKLEADEHA